MTELEFKSLVAQGYNRIPLMLEAFADLETPLSLYLKLAHAEYGGRNSFLLESVVGGERFGRYSFIGLPARTLLRASGFGADARTEVVTDGQVVETASGNPLDFIAQYQQRFKVAVRPGMPRFCGGLAGYFGYDAVRYIEKKLEASCPPDDLHTPDILLLQCEEVAVIDNLSGKLYLLVYVDPAQPEAYSRGHQRLRTLRQRLNEPAVPPVTSVYQSEPVERIFAKDDYLQAVQRGKDLIAAGDFMQVQVGQRLQKRFAAHPLNLYRALRSLNPSPYMYYYHFGDFQVIGSSPEILVRHEHEADGSQSVTIRPLAGTRPRGATSEADLATEQELINDPKERAEHVMLIDLARNDIGRIARTGSVKVTEAFAIERYSHVMHIVSNVQGTLLDGTVFDDTKGKSVELPLQVIPGFAEALTTMPVGSKWIVYIPSELAYGENTPGAPIEPNSPLIFDLELDGISEAPAPQGGPMSISPEQLQEMLKQSGAQQQ